MAEPAKPSIPFFEQNKFMLFTDSEGGKRARLIPSTRDGYPRFTVFTASEHDQGGKGMINAALDIITTMGIMDRIVEIARKGEMHGEYVPCRTRKRNEDGSMGEIQHVSNVIYGQDKDGLNFIEIRSTDDTRPKLRFFFTISNYHDFCSRDGTAFTPKESSKIAAVAWAEGMKKLFLDKCEWVNTEERRKAAGNGGGYQRKAAAGIEDAVEF